jgi:hypothetical protein
MQGAMESATPVVNVRFVQLDAFSTRLTWMHQFFEQVQNFDVACQYTDPSDGSIRELGAENVDKTACEDLVCSKEQFEGISPGMTVSCGVRASLTDFGWSNPVVKSVVVIGPPSEPSTPTISHTVTPDFSITKWRFAWASPADNGDGRGAGVPGRTQLNGYDVEVSCGSVSPKQLSVSNVPSASFTAIWRAEDFVMTSSLDLTFSLECSKGDDMKVKVRARNALFSGAWSALQTSVTIGVPPPVTETAVLEVEGGLQVTWQPGIDASYGGGGGGEWQITGFRVESSICEDFDRLNEGCLYYYHDVGYDVGEYILTSQALIVSGTGYWIRVSARNALGFGQTGVAVKRNFLVVPRILSPVNFPLGVTFVEDMAHVWDGAAYTSSLVLTTWGLDLEDVDQTQPVQCNVDFGDQTLNTDAHILSQTGMDTILEVELSRRDCSGVCRAQVTCLGDQISFPIEYFTYPVPKIMNMLPSEGPIPGGVLVKLSIVDHSGARSKYAAGLTDNLLSASEGDTTLAVRVICGSGEFVDVEGALTRSAGDVSSVGQTTFDLNLVMPPCPCGEEAATELILLFGPSVVAWKLRDGSPPMFKYIGAAISRVDPPAAMIHPGTGGTMLSVVLINMNADCELRDIRAGFAYGRVGDMYPCNVLEKAFDAAARTLIVKVHTPELDAELAGVHMFAMEGCPSFNGETLFFEWEMLQRMEPAVDDSSIEVDGRNAQCVSSSATSTTLSLQVMHVASYGYDSYAVVGMSSAHIMHYQTGGGVQFQITFDATQLSVGTQVLQIQGMKTAVQLSLSSKDVVSGASLSGLTYAVYAD